MDDHQFPHTSLQQRAGGMSQGNRVELVPRQPDFEPRGFASLNFIQNAVIHIPQSGADYFRISIAIFAHNIDAGFHARGLSAG